MKYAIGIALLFAAYWVGQLLGIDPTWKEIVLVSIANGLYAVAVEWDRL